jgi:hypothetical protein
MRLTVIAIMSVCVLLTAGCSRSKEEGSGSDGKSQEALPAGSVPVPVAPPVVASRFTPCPAMSPAIFCSGPIIVTAGQPVITKDGEALKDGRQRLNARIEFTVESRTGGPVMFNLANQDVKINLQYGIVLESNIFYEQFRSGVTPCIKEREICLQVQRDNFLTAPPPGESKPRFTLFYKGYVDASLVKRLPDVATAGTAFEAYVVETGQPDSTVKVSFSELPTQNLLAQ